MSFLQPPNVCSPRVHPNDDDSQDLSPSHTLGSTNSGHRPRNLSSILFPSTNSSPRLSQMSGKKSHGPGNRTKRVSHNIANLINLTQLILQSKKQAEESEDTILEEYALCCVHRDHSIRQYLHQHIVNHKYFEGLILFIITLNIVFLSLDDPDADFNSSNLQFAVLIVEVICTTFYVIETCLKVLTYGFILGKHSYLRCSHYNQIDFVVVLSSVLELVLRYTLTKSGDGEVVRWIGFGKVLRPLRFLAMVPDLQVLLQQFVVAIPLLTNAFVLLAFLFLIWGLVGVQLFSGKLRYRCLNDETLLFDERFDTRPTQQPNCSPIAGGRSCSDGYSCVYTNENPNFSMTSFDNLGAAVLSIFVSVTMENWTVCMYRVQDAFSFWTWPYFVLLIVFGSFFVINLTLVAIKAQMLDSEETQKRVLRLSMDAEGKSGEFPDDKLTCDMAMNLGSSINNDSSDNTDPLLDSLADSESETSYDEIKERERRQSSNATHGMELDSSMLGNSENEGFCGSCSFLSAHNEWIQLNLTSKSWFDNFFMACIGINTLTLTIEHHGQPPLLDDILRICNYIFTGLFLMEMVLKIAGFSFRGYIGDRFNIFDGLIAMISLFEVLISSGAGFLSATRIFRLARIFRMVRVFRVMKIVRYLESFQRLMGVVKKSIHSILYISALMLIFIFMYAMLGFHIFRDKFRFPEDVEYDLPEIPRANFENLFWSFVTVFQILTLEEWVNIMYDGVRATNLFSILYFVSFVVIGVYCLLNMFLAIVLQNFEADHRYRLEAKIQKQRELDALKTIGRGSDNEKLTQQQTLNSALISDPNLIATQKSTWRHYLSCRRRIRPERAAEKMMENATEIVPHSTSIKMDSINYADDTMMEHPPPPSPQIKPFDVDEIKRNNQKNVSLTLLQPVPPSRQRGAVKHSYSNSLGVDDDVEIISLSAPSNPFPSRTASNSSNSKDDDNSVDSNNTNQQPGPRKLVHREFKSLRSRFNDNTLSTDEPLPNNMGTNGDSSNVDPSSSSKPRFSASMKRPTLDSNGDSHNAMPLTINLEPPTGPQRNDSNSSDPSYNRELSKVSFSVSVTRDSRDKSDDPEVIQHGFRRQNSRYHTIQNSIVSGTICMEESDSDSENLFRVMASGTKSYQHRKSISVAMKRRQSPSISRSRSIYDGVLSPQKSLMGFRNSASSPKKTREPRRRSSSVSLGQAFATSLRHSLRAIQNEKTSGTEEMNLESSDNVGCDMTNEETLHRKDSGTGSKGSDNSILALGKTASVNMQKLRTAVGKNKQWELLPEELALENHIFAENKWYRMLRHYVLCSTFQAFILLLIVISSINLAVDTPKLPLDSLEKQIIDMLDTVLVIIFTVEMILKIFVMGLIGMEGAYLNDTWNQLDGAIVITSIIPKILGSTGGILGTFRVLRAFRPLRIAARYEELRIVLTALGRSVPAMVNVFGVLLFFWLIFGILSVQLFGGKFYDCDLEDKALYDQIVEMGVGDTDMEKCLSLGGEWTNPDFHFDNILSALRSLFVISTLEGWHNIMYHAVDATEIDALPRADASTMSALFFIVFILVGSFFLISLFVGIIFDNFVKLRDEATGVGMLTPEQKSWVNLQNKIINSHPIPLPLPPSLIRYKSAAEQDPSQSKFFTNLLHNVDLSQRREEDRTFRGWCYYIGISTRFEMAMMIAICLNIGVMCFKYEEESEAYRSVFEVINTVFTWIFVVEAAIKIIGFGVRQYWTDIWNKFDFIIVVGALFEFVMDYVVSSNAASGSAAGQGTSDAAQSTDITFLRILRVFRVSRLVRIVKSAERLKSLMRTLVKSMRSLLSIGILLGLMYFVSAILAMNIFYDIELVPGKCIDSHANFQTFHHSALTMFRVSTGEDWDCIMADACNEKLGGHSFCWMFFMLFYLVVSFVTLYLFIAIILQAFDPNDDGSDDTPGGIIGPRLGSGNGTKEMVTEDMIAEFIDSWSYYDPLATGYMDYSSFEHFLQKIRKPMGIGQYGTRTEMFKILNRTEIIVHQGNRLNFTEVLYSMCERIDGCWINEESKVYHKINKQLARRFDLFEEDCPSLGVLLAVTKAQRIWKKKIAAKKAREQMDSLKADKEALGRVNTLEISKGQSKLFAFMQIRRQSQDTLLEKRQKDEKKWKSNLDNAATAERAAAAVVAEEERGKEEDREQPPPQNTKLFVTPPRTSISWKQRMHQRQRNGTLTHDDDDISIPIENMQSVNCSETEIEIHSLHCSPISIPIAVHVPQKPKTPQTKQSKQTPRTKKFLANEQRKQQTKELVPPTAIGLLVPTDGNNRRLSANTANRLQPQNIAAVAAGPPSYSSSSLSTMALPGGNVGGLLVPPNSGHRLSANTFESMTKKVKKKKPNEKKKKKNSPKQKRNSPKQKKNSPKQRKKHRRKSGNDNNGENK